MSFSPGILARGPWPADAVGARWREDPYEPGPERNAAADRAIAALEDRGSPAHDGLAARLADYSEADGRLELEL
jgi:8-oxo-dGTP diphosphatase